MSVLWERFAGQTDRFAIRLTMMTDPHDGAGATRAESASWGSLQIWVNDQNLCAHVDQGETLTSVHWYLLPLLEWVAANWNPLLHEEKLPNRNLGESAAQSLHATRLAPALAGEEDTEDWEQEWFDWRARHALRSARSGGLLPNIVLRRLRDDIEISWTSELDAGAPPGFSFVSGAGSALLDPAHVAGPLYEVVSAAAHHLRHIGDHDMAGLLAALDSAASSARQHDERVAWMAGVQPDIDRGPADRSVGVETAWESIVRSLRELGSPDASRAALSVDESDLVVTGSSQAALLFSSVSPTVRFEDVRTLSTILVEQFDADIGSSLLDEYWRDTPLDPGVPAWEQGYELAEDLHSELDLDVFADWVDVEGLLRSLGVRMIERQLTDPDIKACSVVGPLHRPVVVHNSHSPFQIDVARRFTLAHELCHLLYDRGVGAQVAIASGPWAPRSIERRANAFAAMFLMPGDLIRAHAARMDVAVNRSQGITSLASRLRVSRRALTEHLFNLNLLTETERDQMSDRTNE